MTAKGPSGGPSFPRTRESIGPSFPRTRESMFDEPDPRPLTGRGTP